MKLIREVVSEKGKMLLLGMIHKEMGTVWG